MPAPTTEKVIVKLPTVVMNPIRAEAERRGLRVNEMLRVVLADAVAQRFGSAETVTR